MNTKKPCSDHLGNKFDSITDMCKYWNISISTFTSRVNSGWSLKNALETRIKSNKIDHNGNGFNTLNKMCEHWEIDIKTYQHRVKSGWSIEDTLETPLE